MTATDVARILARAKASGALIGGPGLVSSFSKLPEGPDRSVITRLGGIPVGFQFATALGMDGMPALVLDILTDPTTYLTGGLGSTLSKGGKAGRVLRTAARLKKKADPLLSGLDELSAVRKLKNTDLFESGVRAVETAGRMDTYRLEKLRERVMKARTDGEALDFMRLFRDTDEKVGVIGRTRALRGATEADAADAKKLIRARRKVTGNAAADEQTEAVIKAMQADPKNAREAAIKQIDSMVDARREIAELAEKAKTAPSIEAFENIARKLAKLTPSKRTQLMLSEARLREIRYASEAMSKGKQAEALGDIGKRGLLQFRTPIGEFNPGSGLVERVGGTLKETPFIGDLIARTRVGGLVPNVAEGRSARMTARVLEEYQTSNAPEVLSDVLRQNTAAVRGIALTDPDFTSINRALSNDLVRTGIHSARAERSIEAYGKAFGWGDEDFLNLIKLVDRPDEYLAPLDLSKLEGNLASRLDDAAAVFETRSKRVEDLRRRIREASEAPLGPTAKVKRSRRRASLTEAEQNLADKLDDAAEEFEVRSLRVEELKKARRQKKKLPEGEDVTALDKRIEEAEKAAKEGGSLVRKLEAQGPNPKRVVKGGDARHRGKGTKASLARLERQLKYREGKAREAGRKLAEVEAEASTVRYRMREFSEAGKAAGMTEAHLELAEQISREMARMGKVLEGQGAIESSISNYFPRLVSRVKKGREADFEAALAEGFFKGIDHVGKQRTNITTFLSHGKVRLVDAFEGLLDMERRGLIEVEKNPAKIISSYFNAAGTSAAQARFLRRMGKATHETAETFARGAKGEAVDVADQLPLFLVARTADKLSKKAQRAMRLGDYVSVSDPDIIKMVQDIGRASGRKIMNTRGNLKTHRAADRSSFRNWERAQVVYMPRSAMKALRAVVRESAIHPAGKAIEGLTEKGMRGALELNALAKRSLLLVSAFHHMALSESGVAVMGGKFFRNGPRILRGLRKRQRDFFEATDIMDQAMRHGLQLGSPIDPQLDDLQRILGRLDNVTHTNAFGMMGKGAAWWDRGLWDFYHNGLKLQAYNELTWRTLARPKYRNADPRVLMEGIAEHVNNAFGGQNWRSFWVGKRAQQWGRLMLLAPDWTASNLRIAGDVFANFFKRNTPGLASVGGRFPITTADLLRADVRATFARQYALRASIAAAVGWNFLNYALTSWNGGDVDMSKGRFLDGNEEGTRHLVDTGFFNQEGRKLFLSPGKQFREPFDLIHSLYSGVPGVPSDFARRKSSPSVSMAWAAYTGKDVFGAPIAATDGGPIQRIGDTIGFASTEYLPIPVQNVMEGRGSVPAGLGAMGLPIKAIETLAQQAAEDQLSNPEYVKGLTQAQKRYQKKLLELQS